MAERLAIALPAVHLELDAFLQRNQGGYLEFLRYDELEHAIADRDHNSPILIEGVCIHEVLARIGLTASIQIYVKRTGPYGLWYDDSDIREDTFEAALAVQRVSVLLVDLRGTFSTITTLTDHTRSHT